MGDKYIKRTAEIIKDTLRSKDIVARVGGDEFAIILPETDYNTAGSVAERILNNIAKENKLSSLPEPLSLALGYETTDCENRGCNFKNIKNCYNQADKNMYKQKFAERS